jgi:hypothetical protein
MQRKIATGEREKNQKKCQQVFAREVTPKKFRQRSSAKEVPPKKFRQRSSAKKKMRVTVTLSMVIVDTFKQRSVILRCKQT